MTAALGVNNRVNETSGITVQLKIRSEDTNFITQALLLLAAKRLPAQRKDHYVKVL
jgi:hypothetical protein